MHKTLLWVILGAGAFHGNAYAGNKEKIKHERNDAIVVKLSTKGNDIAFDQVAVQIPFSNKISLTFNNEATKGSEILHNVAILKPGTLDSFLKDLQTAGYDMDKIKNHPSIIVMTAALAPGAAETVNFSPKEPGFYPYVCVMPGHADMLNMKGTLNIVKATK